MKIPSRPLIVLLFLVLTGLVLNFRAHLLRAQEPAREDVKEKKEPVQMAVGSPLALTQKPLSVVVRPGRWFPVGVTLSNTGEGVQGRLTLTLLKPAGTSGPAPEFFTDVDLPTNSRKRIWLYGRIARDDIDRFEVTFQGRGFKRKRVEGVVQNAAPRTRIVITVSDTEEKLSYLTGLTGPGLGLAEDDANAATMGALPSNPNLNLNATPLRPLGATHDMVPSRWIGFDTADLVVLHDFPHTALTPNQISALRSYVASGGSLLVLGGANWQRLASSPLADLWPVTPQGSGTAAASDAALLIDRFARYPNMTGADRLGGAPVVAMRTMLKSGCRKVLGKDASPLLAINDFGGGQVIFLSVDPTQPPFLGWRGLPRLWADVFRPTARPTQIQSAGGGKQLDSDYSYGYMEGPEPVQKNQTDVLFGALATAPQLRTPSVSFIAWFLALYVFFLVPVNYVVLRYFDKREMAWVTIPVIVIGFSLMSYAAALRIKGTAVLTRQVNLVQSSASVNGTPSKWARADAMLWLFSPRKTSYDISSNDPQMVVADYLVDEDTRTSIREPEENQAFALDGAPINMWDYRSFVGHSVADLKGGVRLVTTGNSVGIRNDTPHPLKGVVLVSQGRLWAYKSIKTGKTVHADTRYGDKTSKTTGGLAERVEKASRYDSALNPIFSGATSPDENAPQTGFATVPKRLLDVALSKPWSLPATYIVAWADVPVAGLTIGKRSDQATNLSLLIFRVENDAALRPLLAEGGKEAANRPQLRLMSTDIVPGKTGAISDFEVRLSSPNVGGLQIRTRVAPENQYDYEGVAMKKPAPLLAEIFNVETGVWQSLPLRVTKKVTNSGNEVGWQLAGGLDGKGAQACVLAPDGIVQLRLKLTQDAVVIRSLSVNGGEWKGHTGNGSPP